MQLFSFGKKGAIRLVPVDLGVRTVDVPVADITGNRPGRTLLVTAGMDGDEYAGMEAAYRLIDEYADGDFAGRLIVVPIVNVPGFYQESSENPFDGLYPKMRGLGEGQGTPTDRLVHWVAAFATQSDCWYDMHGGAITEGLQPFLWVYRTSAPADVVARDFLAANVVGRVVEEKVTGFSKAGQLAAKGCCYMLAESGARGGRNEEDVDRHLTWVHGLMTVLGMDTYEHVAVTQPKIYRHVEYCLAPGFGIWRPKKGLPEVAAGEVLGTSTRFDGTREVVIQAKHEGVRLWWKETMALRKGDVICAIAYN